MSRLKTVSTDAIIVAGFFILPFLLFATVTLGSKTMLPADNLVQWFPWATAGDELNVDFPHNGLLSDMILENYAWKRFIASNLRQGDIPLWNPYNFAGTPFLANGQHSAYYPFSVIFLILPIAKAYGWYTVIQLWLAGVFAYLLGRVLGMRRPSATIAGLVFQGSGFLIVSSAVFPMILAAAIWLPLLLACVEKIIRNASSPFGAGRTLPWAVLGAAALGIQLLAGHIEITYYTLLVMGIFALWRLAGRVLDWIRNGTSSWLKKLIRPAAWLAGFILIGLLIGAVQFIPFLEVGQANFREGSATLEQIQGWAFPPRRALTLVMPDFFGSPADHTYLDIVVGRSIPFTTNYYGETNPHGAFSSDWGIKNYVEGGIYLGVLTLLLAFLGVWSAWRRRPDRRSEISFFTILSLLSLSFIFGTPLYAILYYGLPGINQLHSPFRWVFPLTLSVALLAGYGMDAVAESREQSLASAASRKRRDHRRSPLASLFTLNAEASAVTIVAGLAFWGGLLISAALLFSRIFYRQIESFLERFFLGLERAPDAFSSTQAFYGHEFEQIAILALMLIASGLVLRMSRSTTALAGRPLWIFLAAIVVGLDLFIAGYGFNASADPALLEYKPELVQWLEEQPGTWRLTPYTPHGDKPLNANLPWLSDLQDIRGYDSIILKQYTDYMAAIEPQNELEFNRVQPLVNWQSINSPLLDLLGVKYIVTREQIELPKLQHLWRGEGLHVYENLAVVPRAYTISQLATVVTDDALRAMQTLDPRNHVILEEEDWSGDFTGEAIPQALTPAEITDYQNIEVTIQAAVGEASWLVLNDTYFQGWNAYVQPLEAGVDSEEEQVDLYRVNGNFRGVLLEPGNWQVRFRYSPLTFKLGGLASFMGLVIIAFAVVVWAWRRLVNPDAPLTNTRSIAKNSLAPMGLNLFNKAIDFVFAAFYLRVLGPGDSGKFATAIIIAGWFEIIANWGLNTLLIREVAKDKSQASRYLLNTSLLRIATAIIASLPIFIYIFTVSRTGDQLDQQTTAAILFLMVGMIFSGLGQGLAGLFYAYEQAEVPAVITTVTTIFKVGLGVLVLLLGFSFVGLAAITIVVNLVTLLILLVAAFRQFRIPGPWSVDFVLQRRMFKLSYPLMLNHLFAVIFFQIDIPLMNQINGDVVVGWYNSAYKWVNAFNVIPSFFTFALFPVISRQVQSALPDAQRTFRFSIKLMLLISLPLAAITTLLAPLMIGILGGREFLPHGAIALQLVIWSIPIGWMNSVTNYVLIALGCERYLTRAFILGVGFNLIANLIFLPRYSYVAASIITILSEIVLLAVFAYYLRPSMPKVGWAGIIKRPLAVTAIMLWAIVLGTLVSPILALILGLVAYPVGLWLLRVFGDEERQILGALLPEELANRLSLAKAETGDLD